MKRIRKYGTSGKVGIKEEEEVERERWKGQNRGSKKSKTFKEQKKRTDKKEGWKILGTYNKKV